MPPSHSYAVSTMVHWKPTATDIGFPAVETAYNYDQLETGSRSTFDHENPQLWTPRFAAIIKPRDT